MIKYLQDKQVSFEKRLEVFEELRNSLSRNHLSGSRAARQVVVAVAVVVDVVVVVVGSLVALELKP